MAGVVAPMNFYLDANTLSLAHSIYLDSGLSVFAADGYYSDGIVSRKLLGGILLPAETCSCTPSCPERRVVFQICNSNFARDDNFAIYLNGTFIGIVDLSTDAQVGSVFIADLNPFITISSSDFVCPLSGMVIYRFNPALLFPTNTLEMRNIQNNGNDNYGTIGIRNYYLSGTSLSDPCVIDDLYYEGLSGESFTFNFNYTQCCAPAAAKMMASEPPIDIQQK